MKNYEQVRSKYKKKLKEDTKTIGVRIPYSDYEAILVECKNTNSNLTQYFNRLVKLSRIDTDVVPEQKSIDEIKDTLRKDPNFKDSFKKQLELPLRKVGRPKKERPEPMSNQWLMDTLHREATMKTLDEYNESKKNPHLSSYEKNGILCPDCKCELFDTNPSVRINEKTPVHCECGFVGSRYL